MDATSKPVDAGDETVSMAELERGFQRVVQELVNDKSLEKFRIEYEKLHEALIASHEHNDALVKRASELNEDILKNSKQIAGIIAITQQDQRTIATLRQEFEKAWSIIDLSSEKEQKSRMIILNLKIEIENLSKLVTLEKNDDMASKMSIQEIQNEIENLKNEISNNNDNITQLRKDIETTEIETSSMMKAVKEAIPEIEDSEKEIIEGRKTMTDIVEHIEKIQKETAEHQNLITESINSNDSVKAEIHSKKANIKSMKQLKLRLRENMKNAEEDKTLFLVSLHKTQKLYDKALEDTQITQKLKDNKIKAIEERENYKKSLPDEIVKLDQENKDLKHDEIELKRYKKELAAAKLEYRKAVTENQKILSQGLIDMSLDQLNIRKMRLEHDDADKVVREIQNKIGQEKLLIQFGESQTKSIQGDIVVQKVSIRDDSSLVYQIKHDIEENIQKKTEAMHNMKTEQDIIEKNMSKLDELNLTLNDIQNQKHYLETQKVGLQNDYETLKRQLEHEQKANDVIRTEYKQIKQQANQFKEEIRKVDDKTAHEHLQNLNLEAELEKLAGEKEDLEKAIERSNELNKQLEEAIENKAHIITQADIDVQSLTNVNNNVKSDLRMIKNGIAKNLLEIQQQHSTLTSMKNVLTQCHHSFEEIVDKIEERRNNLFKELERRDKLKYKLKVCKALEEEYKRLFKELIYNQGLSQAIEQELPNPITVNKWVFLDHTDPERANLLRLKYKLIDKITAAVSRYSKLKTTEKKTKEDLKKAEIKLKRCHCNSYLDQMRDLTQALEQKTKELDRLENKFVNKNADIQKEQINVEMIRDELRTERIETSQIKSRAMSARASTANNRERFRQVQRRYRGDSVFVGGGFALPLNNSEALPLVKMPKDANKYRIQSARPDVNNLPRLNLKTATEGRRASDAEYEYAIRPPSSRPLGVPKSARRFKEFLVEK